MTLIPNHYIISLYRTTISTIDLLPHFVLYLVKNFPIREWENIFLLEWNIELWYQLNTHRVELSTPPCRMRRYVCFRYSTKVQNIQLQLVVQVEYSCVIWGLIDILQHVPNIMWNSQSFDGRNGMFGHNRIHNVIFS
jgi:hypothetical protein